MHFTYTFPFIYILYIHLSTAFVFTPGLKGHWAWSTWNKFKRENHRNLKAVKSSIHYHLTAHVWSECLKMKTTIAQTRPLMQTSSRWFPMQKRCSASIKNQCDAYSNRKTTTYSHILFLNTVLVLSEQECEKINISSGVFQKKGPSQKF